MANTTHGDLDLAPVGNCAASALIDRYGRYVWACTPRVDGDPFFSALLSGEDPASETARGIWAVDLEGLAAAEQSYARNTAILTTRLTDEKGGVVEIVDFCPRYKRLGRVFRPIAFVRIVRPVSGSPRIRMRLAPTADWGARDAERTWGSNHIRYLGSGKTLRLTTNAPVSHVLNARSYLLEQEQVFYLGPDESFVGDLAASMNAMAKETAAYWRDWVRTLTLPLDWQNEVIRAAIALKLCVYEETGAIVAALTTSIPEAPGSGRNWDYRFCWLRDAYYTIQALNRLGAVDILEGYLSYLRNLIDQSADGAMQPVYGVGYEAELSERQIETLPGYRGMGPVRSGNQAYVQRQNDVYGQIILSSVQAFFDERLLRPSGVDDFRAMERVGDKAYEMAAAPDAGLWEFRTRAAVHTYSAVMCWAACDRLANAANKLGLPDREALWRARAGEIGATIEAEAWRPELGRFAATFGGDEIDASLLQLIETRFLSPDDDRYRATLAAVEESLARGRHLMRYSAPDDFGAPETAFNFCTFWFIEALARTGRTEEAREWFADMLSRLTSAGLLSEDTSLEDGALWGNYPQTYSLVGLINCAVLLSRPWTAVR